MPAGDDSAELADAMQHFAAKRWAEAERICASILTSQPNHARALHLCGAAAAQRGQIDRAIALLRRAVAAQPAAFDPRIDLARLLVLANRPVDAAQEYETAAAAGTVVAAEWCRLSNALLESRQFGAAEAAARRAIAADAHSAAARIN